MKHLGWELRLDWEGDACLKELRTGKTACIVWCWDDFYCFPADIPWRIIHWSLRKMFDNQQRLMREEYRDAGRYRDSAGQARELAARCPRD